MNLELKNNAQFKAVWNALAARMDDLDEAKETSDDWTQEQEEERLATATLLEQMDWALVNLAWGA